MFDLFLPLHTTKHPCDLRAVLFDFHPVLFVNRGDELALVQVRILFEQFQEIHKLAFRLILGKRLAQRRVVLLGF